MIAFTAPSGTVTSTSPTYPNRQPSHRLMTSLRRSAVNLHSIAITSCRYPMRGGACPILAKTRAFRRRE